MSVIDASVIVSQFVPDDVNHDASRRWLLEQLGVGTLLVAPILLLAEVGGSIARRTNDPIQARNGIAWLQALPNLQIVPLDEELGELATQMAIHLRLRGADAIYVAVARQLDIPLVSWDKEHHGRAGSIIQVLSPDDS